MVVKMLRAIFGNKESSQMVNRPSPIRPPSNPPNQGSGGKKENIDINLNIKYK